MSVGKKVPFQLRPLDKNFVGAKPIENVPEKVFQDLEMQRRLIITRKRNGNAAYVSVTGKKKRVVEIYSRGIHEQTYHFPEIVSELEEMDLPEGTLLAGELLVQVKGRDSPEEFGRFARSKAERAVSMQKNEGTKIKLALFNVVALNGQIALGFSFENRLSILRDLMRNHRTRNVGLVEVLDMPFERAKRWSIGEEWEGLVLYDRDATSAYRIDGKLDQVPRPEGCWKWKQYLESDFVVTGWKPSDAPSHFGQVRDLLIGQYDPHTRELVHWGKIGKLSKAKRKEYMDDSLYPMVVEVKFERRTSNNRLVGATILRFRTDKKPEECIGPHI